MSRRLTSRLSAIPTCQLSADGQHFSSFSVLKMAMQMDMEPMSTAFNRKRNALETMALSRILG